MSQSQRRSERFATRLTVRWMRKPHPIEIVAVDVNLHGMFLQTDETIIPNGLMQLEARLPEGTISMFARARFVGRTVSGHGIGIEIFLMDERDRANWEAYYRRLVAAHRSAGGHQEIDLAASIA